MAFTKGTYGYLQYRIADELGDRQTLLQYLGDSGLNPANSPGFSTYGGYIQDAVQSAIAEWEGERFWFNELLIPTIQGGSSVWNTAAGQEFYNESTAPSALVTPSLSDVAKIDKMWVLINGNRWPLEFRTDQIIVDTSLNPLVQGMPADVAWVGGFLQFYPIPDNAYQLGMFGTKRFSALSALIDTNAWTTWGFDLIRCTAKMFIARDYLHNQAIASENELAIYGDSANPKSRGYLGQLKRETNRRKGQGKIRPTSF